MGPGDKCRRKDDFEIELSIMSVLLCSTIELANLSISTDVMNRRIFFLCVAEAWMDGAG